MFLLHRQLFLYNDRLWLYSVQNFLFDVVFLVSTASLFTSPNFFKGNSILSFPYCPVQWKVNVQSIAYSNSNYMIYSGTPCAFLYIVQYTYQYISLRDSASFISCSVSVLCMACLPGCFHFPICEKAKKCYFVFVVCLSDGQATTKQRHCVLQGWSSKNRLCIVLCRWQRWRKEAGRWSAEAASSQILSIFTVLPMTNCETVVIISQFMSRTGIRGTTKRKWDSEYIFFTDVWNQWLNAIPEINRFLMCHIMLIFQVDAVAMWVCWEMFSCVNVKKALPASHQFTLCLKTPCLSL